MIDRDSRYAKSAVLHLTDAQGRDMAYLDRRIIPDAPRIAARITVQDGDRLDLVAHRAYGDARQSWRVMDAYPDPDPLTLADTPGRRLGLTQPGEG